MQVKIDGFKAEKIIPANDSVRLLDEISEELDFRNLFRAYSHIGRKPAKNPITLFKILVYGASWRENIQAESLNAPASAT